MKSLRGFSNFQGFCKALLTGDRGFGSRFDQGLTQIQPNSVEILNSDHCAGIRNRGSIKHNPCLGLLLCGGDRLDRPPDPILDGLAA
ncbi:hypothetical protein AMR42_11510 [Limnothrix sp. PR1529]|nr:hypothetical protein BCR12_04570 [Limnothrix sp. P13C2]PIB09960.1 hypothetical protein AMR42_11510 [Limnothrix sp. PR1529]